MCKRQLIDVFLSHQCLSPSLSLTLKSMSMSSGESKANKQTKKQTTITKNPKTTTKTLVKPWKAKRYWRKVIAPVSTTWLRYEQYLPSQNYVNSEYCLTKLCICVEDMYLWCRQGSGEKERILIMYNRYGNTEKKIYGNTEKSRNSSPVMLFKELEENYSKEKKRVNRVCLQLTLAG